MQLFLVLTVGIKRNEIHGKFISIKKSNYLSTYIFNVIIATFTAGVGLFHHGVNDDPVFNVSNEIDMSNPSIVAIARHSNVTDEDFDWYKPVAVILKPASKRDLHQKRLLPLINVDEILFVSSFSRLHRPSLLPPYWPFVHDHCAFHRLTHIYRYELPGHEKRNLLSLARMGLVAIPNRLRKSITKGISEIIENKIRNKVR